MKHSLSNTLYILLALIVFTFYLSSCYETHYYHHYHHHTREWYDHRHMPPPAGVNFEVDIEARHRGHHRH